MEEGSFRCDANISLLPEGSKEFTAKVEVKNLNSFKAVYLAMEYEAQRQRKAADEGKRLVQETRGWLDEKGKTVSQRSKEYAHDYRYFPEPDLPPVVISRDWIETVKKKLPELPEARRDRFMAAYGLPRYDADLLTTSKAMAEYFEEGVKASKEVAPKEISNWLLGEVSRIINAGNIDIDVFRKQVSPPVLAGLILSSHGTINAATAKSVLEEMFRTGKTAPAIIKERGLSQISDTGELEKIVAEVINSNTQAVNDYRAGKETAAKFLVGQVMKATKGRANPRLVNEVLKQKLAKA
jgi:aspartyl-tRNA(Asn)/glutamyl-tRNA(Gln) amidotransferase subunit B